LRLWIGTNNKERVIDIFGIKKKSFETVNTGGILSFLGVLGADPSSLSEATYFACLKILSESIAKLPLKLQQTTANGGVTTATRNKLYSVCRYRPNPLMTASAFWGAVEFNRNHYGNAYCLITGYPNNVQLWILESSNVEIWYDDALMFSDRADLWYIYTSKKGKMKFSSAQILHFKTSTSADGLSGLSVQTQLATTLTGNKKAQDMLNGLYDNGFTAKCAVQYTGSANPELEKKFVKGLEDYATGKLDVKSIIPIPLGSSITPLNIKLTDAQFLELKKYSALQIAAAFGIKPNQINDYEKSSYSSAEAQQLAFYVDTLLYIIKQYEEEINFKLLSEEDRAKGYSFKFNVGVILRADTKTQIESITQAVSNGLYTPNEARALLDMPSAPGGDKLYFNGSNIPIEFAGKQYKAKGGDNKNG